MFITFAAREELQEYLDFLKLPSLFGKMLPWMLHFVRMSASSTANCFIYIIDNVWSIPTSSASAFKAVFSVFRQGLCAHTEWWHFAVCAHTKLDTNQQNRLFA